jgi:hypothetical protein
MTLATTRFQIDNYQITLGPDLPSIVTNIDTKVTGIIGCYGKEYQLMINLVEESGIIPRSNFDVSRKTGAIFLPDSQLNNYVDLLRNEKPVFAYCNDEKPEWSNISTSHEPVGENERK